jgi:hypothetical protein
LTVKEWRYPSRTELWFIKKTCPLRARRSDTPINFIKNSLFCYCRRILFSIKISNRCINGTLSLKAISRKGTSPR